MAHPRLSRRGLLLLAAAAAASGAVGSSSATFTAQSASRQPFSTKAVFPSHETALSIESPAGGETVGPSPELKGSAADGAGDSRQIVIRLWDNETGRGDPARTLRASREGASWRATAEPALRSGAWSAQATQERAGVEALRSELRVFTVDATAPGRVRIRSPRRGWVTVGAPEISGQAGEAPGDSQTVTVKLYSGRRAAGTAVRTLSARRKGEAWSVAVAPALPDGRYTARAEQLDDFGNLAQSRPRTFGIDTSAPQPQVLSPADGAAAAPRIAIWGRAGADQFDREVVTVLVYPGAEVSGAPVWARVTRRDAVSGAFSATTEQLAPGRYTIQVRQSDRAGNAGRSAPVTVTVGEVSSAPSARGISAVNGDGRSGRPDRGDAVTFAYSAAIAPSSVLGGWDGSPAAVNVRFFDVGGHDTFTILDSAARANVHLDAGDARAGGVDTDGNYVSKTTTVAAWMRLAPDSRSVVVTLADDVSGSRARRGRGWRRDMQWTVGTSVTDLAGTQVAAGTVTEDDRDQDF